MTTTDLCTEEELKVLVHAFYARVRQDAVLAPIFNARIDDWDHHLDKLVDFWSSVLRRTGRYTGNPMQKHAALPELSAELFERWLALFGERGDEGGHFHVGVVDDFDGACGQVGAGGMYALDFAECALDFAHASGAVHAGHREDGVDRSIGNSPQASGRVHSTSRSRCHSMPSARLGVRNSGPPGNRRCRRRANTSKRPACPAMVSATSRPARPVSATPWPLKPCR